MATKVKIEGPTVQDYVRSLGLLPGGRIPAFIRSEIVRMADNKVPSDTTAIRESVFVNTDFNTGPITYTIYGNPDGRHTYNDTTSRFQDAPTRGPFWIERTLNEGGRYKLMLGIKRLLSRR